MAERTQQLTETNELLRERVEEIGRVEESLREEKAFTDAVMDSLPGVFYVLDDETRFVRWNRHMEEVTGLTADQLRGREALSVLHADDAEETARALESTFTTGANETRELRMLTPDGPRYFLLTASRLEGRLHLRGRLGRRYRRETGAGDRTSGA